MSIKPDQVMSVFAIWFVQCLSNQLQPPHRPESLLNMIEDTADSFNFSLPSVNNDLSENYFVDEDPQHPNSTCPVETSLVIIQCSCRLANQGNVTSNLRIEPDRDNTLEHHCSYYSWISDDGSEIIVIVKLKKGYKCMFACEVNYKNTNETVDTYRITFTVFSNYSYIEELSREYGRMVFLGILLAATVIGVFLLALCALRWRANKYTRLTVAEIKSFLEARNQKTSSLGSENSQLTAAEIAIADKLKSILRRQKPFRKQSSKHVLFLDDMLTKIAHAPVPVNSISSSTSIESMTDHVRNLNILSKSLQLKKLITQKMEKHKRYNSIKRSGTSIDITAAIKAKRLQYLDKWPGTAIDDKLKAILKNKK